MKSAVAILLIGSMNLLQAQAPDLQARLTHAITNKVYQTPTRTELTQARQLFRRTLQGHWADGDLTNRWAALDFEFREVATRDESLWLLTEVTGKSSGRGWYLFRTNRQSSIALEAPHPRNDKHTGIIALRLFLAGQTRVFAASTITRHRADVAHLDNTFFQAFTLAFAETCPTGLVVQLHGFDRQNHPDTKADIIASNGTHSPEPWLTDLVQQLNKATPLRVLAYPRDTRRLGATRNTQGQALRQTSTCRFLHLELSRKLRDRLIRDEELLRAILNPVSAITE